MGHFRSWKTNKGFVTGVPSNDKKTKKRHGADDDSATKPTWLKSPTELTNRRQA
jgi:hypothetical protein